MRMLDIADQPLEVRGLLNPALISVMAFRVAEGRYKKDQMPVSLIEMYICLSFLLHRPTFDLIPSSKKTRFQGWIHDNQEVRISLAARIKGLKTYIGAGLILAMETNLLAMNDQAKIVLGKEKPKKPFSSENLYGGDMQVKASYLGSALSDVQPPSFFLTVLGLSL